MRNREQFTELMNRLEQSTVPDVPATFAGLRDDLARTLADLAGDILLHQENCERALDDLPEDFYDDPDVLDKSRVLEPPLWSLIVEDFRRLAGWLPRQRLARFGEQDAVRAFRDRLVVALRPALVELQRYGVLRNGTTILGDSYWQAESLYDLAVRFEGFTLALYRAVQSRIRADRLALETLREQSEMSVSA